MRYRVYVGPPGTESPTPAEGSVSVQGVHAAGRCVLVGASCQLFRPSDALIDGDDGTMLCKQEIAAALHHPGQIGHAA